MDLRRFRHVISILFFLYFLCNFYKIFMSTENKGARRKMLKHSRRHKGYYFGDWLFSGEGKLPDCASVTSSKGKNNNVLFPLYIVHVDEDGTNLTVCHWRPHVANLRKCDFE